MNKISIFIAYSRKDKGYLDTLRTYLIPLTRKEDVTIWYDGEIIPGSTWEDAIKEHLHTADIILMLVSSDSLASEYFYDQEMKDAIERHSSGSATVIPVILRSCMWDLTPLKDLQALPKDGLPVQQWTDQSEAFTDIVRGVHNSIQEIQKKQRFAVEEAKKKEEALQKSIEREKKAPLEDHGYSKPGGFESGPAIRYFLIGLALVFAFLLGRIILNRVARSSNQISGTEQLERDSAKVVNPNLKSESTMSNQSRKNKASSDKRSGSKSNLERKEELEDLVSDGLGNSVPSSKRSGNSGSSSPGVAGPKTTIRFAETTFDFGSVNEDKKVTHIFRFVNSGKEPLIITNAKGACGCTVPEWPKSPIAPGKSGDIKVTFNPKAKKGRQNRKVTVVANTEPPQTFLYVTGEVVE